MTEVRYKPGKYFLEIYFNSNISWILVLDEGMERNRLNRFCHMGDRPYPNLKTLSDYALYGDTLAMM